MIAVAFLAVYVDNVKDEGFALSSLTVSRVDENDDTEQIYVERVDNVSFVCFQQIFSGSRNFLNFIIFLD